MAIKRKSLIGAATAKAKEADSGKKPEAQPTEPAKSATVKKLAVAKLATAKLSTAKLTVLRRLS